MLETGQTIDLVVSAHNTVQVHTSPDHVSTCHYEIFQEKGWINGTKYVLCAEEMFREIASELDRCRQLHTPEPAAA